MQVLSDLSIAMAPEKADVPATTLTFLGIELDSHTLTARLPADNLQRLKTMVSAWQDQKSCTKRELVSLVGTLQHTTMVIRFGRVFLCQMIELAQTASKYHHLVRLNRACRLDLQWWHMALPHWNGTGFLAPAFAASPDILVYTHASGSWGFGGWCQPSHKWFQGSWPVTWSGINITAKELLPNVLATAMWGSLWSGQAVRFYCDNVAIMNTISSGKSTEPLLMQLLRGLHLFAMKHASCFTAAHIAGVENGATDALSRNQAHLFLT